MPYIGKAPVSGGFHKLDSLTASATDTYALTLGSAAYYPETANQLLVSLNGVIQAPQDSFTVSGSNLVFDSALTSSDSIDFVVALGDVLGVGTPTDGTITTAKIGNGAVTSAKLDTNIDIAGTLDVTGALTADTGIKFGSGTKVLQEYSESTWTATLDGVTTSPTTAITETGNYIKIGSLVFIDIQFQNVNTTGASGQVVVTGLPFTPKRNSFNGDAMLLNFAMNTSASNTTPYINATNSRIEFWQSLNTSGWASVDHTATGASRYLWLSMTYATDS